MLEVKLSDFRHPAFFINQTDIVHIIDSRKKKEVGFFIPASLSASFSEYLMQQEKQKKRDLLARVLIAQRQDPVGDVGVSDGVD